MWIKLKTMIIQRKIAIKIWHFKGNFNSKNMDLTVVIIVLWGSAFCFATMAIGRSYTSRRESEALFVTNWLDFMLKVNTHWHLRSKKKRRMDRPYPTPLYWSNLSFTTHVFLQQHDTIEIGENLITLDLFLIFR